MNDEKNKAGEALQKLGQRLRLGFHHRRPTNKKKSDAVMDAVRKQFPNEIDERKRIAKEQGQKRTTQSDSQSPKLAEEPKRDEW